MAKEVHKLQRLKSGDEDPHIKQLYAQSELLKNAHNSMAEHVNRNFQTYTNIQAQLDSRAGALFLVIEDLVKANPALGESLRHTEQVLPGPKTPNWSAYMQEHLTKVHEAMDKYLAEQAATGAATLEPVEVLDPLVTPVVADEPEEEAPIEFGGDHGQSQLQHQPAGT